MSDTPHADAAAAVLTEARTAWRRSHVPGDFDTPHHSCSAAHLHALASLPTETLVGWLVEAGRVEQPQLFDFDDAGGKWYASHGHLVNDALVEIGEPWNKATPLFAFLDPKDAR